MAGPVRKPGNLGRNGDMGRPPMTPPATGAPTMPAAGAGMNMPMPAAQARAHANENARFNRSTPAGGPRAGRRPKPGMNAGVKAPSPAVKTLPRPPVKRP